MNRLDLYVARAKLPIAVSTNGRQFGVASIACDTVLAATSRYVALRDRLEQPPVQRAGDGG